MSRMSNYGDLPGFAKGIWSEFKVFLYSPPDLAMTVPVQLAPGYGTLSAGTVLAKNLSAAGNIGLYVPYNPTTFAAANLVPHPGRAFVTSDTGTAVAYVYVTLNDSYKFIVGDDLIVQSSGQTAENLGAITAIDRTTYAISGRAKITATTNIGVDHTTANYAYVCVEAGDNTNSYSDAVGILLLTVETGTGSQSRGAYSPMLISNVMFVTAACPLLDAAAKTDLTVTDYSNYSLMK